MPLNRRAMLQASLSFLAVGICGCPNKTKTTVKFINSMGSGLTLVVDAAFDTHTFHRSSIGDGKQSSQKYRTNDIIDSTTTLTGTVTVKSGSTEVDSADLTEFILDVTYGRTNTYTVTYTSGNGPFVLVDVT